MVLGPSSNNRDLAQICVHTNRTSNPGGGQNFDRDARPIFLGLKFGQILFFWVGKFLSYFSGFRKISDTFEV